MAVVEKTQSAEEKQNEANSQAEKEAKVAESLLNDLDLTADVEANVARGNKGDEVPEKKGEKEESESEEKESPEEAEAEAESEETEETEDEESEETKGEDTAEEGEETGDAEDKDEELIPKSKVHKRIASLVAQNKALEERLKKIEAGQETPKDPDTQKLEAMSEDQLRQTRKAVEIAIVKEKDEARLEKLLELRDKVETTLTSAPQRFEKSQIAEYDKVADAIAQANEIPINEKTASDLKTIAKEIYQGQPELQRMVKGQAVALNLAYQHYKALLSKSAGKEKVEELKRTNNTLKRKTSLDSAGIKAKASKDALVKSLQEKAFRGGTSKDKVNLIKNDPRFNIDSLIPDDFKGE
jgi:hypothetical protein